MAARRRIIADIAPERSAFARSVLLESWRALLPDTFDTVLPLTLRDRVRLAGSDRLVVSDESGPAAGGRIAAGALELLWLDHAADVDAVPSTPGGVAVSVSAAVDLALDVDDLAAAVTAVAGEQDAPRISVFRLDPRDADRSHDLVRAVRRISTVPVDLVAHDLSTDVTARRLLDSRLVVTVDRTAEHVARCAGVPTVRLGAHDDLTELYVALHAPLDSIDGADLRAARSTAFALDAWQRHRLGTTDVRVAVGPSVTDEDRVAA